MKIFYFIILTALFSTLSQPVVMLSQSYTLIVLPVCTEPNSKIDPDIAKQFCDKINCIKDKSPNTGKSLRVVEIVYDEKYKNIMCEDDWKDDREKLKTIEAYYKKQYKKNTILILRVNEVNNNAVSFQIINPLNFNDLQGAIRIALDPATMEDSYTKFIKEICNQLKLDSPNIEANICDCFPRKKYIVQRAIELYKKNKFEDAQQIFKSINISEIKCEDVKADYHLYIGLTYYALDDFESAETHLEKYLDLPNLKPNPEAPIAYNGAKNKAKSADWFNDPEKRLQWWTKLNPNFKNILCDAYNEFNRNENPIDKSTKGEKLDKALKIIFEDLFEFDIKSPIKAVDLREIENLTNIRRVYLQFSKIDDLGRILHLPKLETLSLGNIYSDSIRNQFKEKCDSMQNITVFVNNKQNEEKYNSLKCPNIKIVKH